jgi:hypothetical protein
MLPAKTPPVLLRSAKIQGYGPFRDFLATFSPLEILERTSLHGHQPEERVSANSQEQVIASGAKQSLAAKEIASSPAAPRNDACLRLSGAI